jgi:hypothetical protein
VIARFAVGDAVRTRSVRLSGHTRLPAYLANRRGRIERVHGAYPLADERAEGAPVPSVQALYAVIFEGAEVWGDSNPEPLTIAADLWDAYLDPDAKEDR